MTTPSTPLDLLLRAHHDLGRAEAAFTTHPGTSPALSDLYLAYSTATATARRRLARLTTDPDTARDAMCRAHLARLDALATRLDASLPPQVALDRAHAASRAYHDALLARTSPHPDREWLTVVAAHAAVQTARLLTTPCPDLPHTLDARLRDLYGPAWRLPALTPTSVSLN